jgi:hypothetical protein
VLDIFVTLFISECFFVFLCLYNAFTPSYLIFIIDLHKIQSTVLGFSCEHSQPENLESVTHSLLNKQFLFHGRFFLHVYLVHHFAITVHFYEI